MPNLFTTRPTRNTAQSKALVDNLTRLLGERGTGHRTALAEHLGISRTALRKLVLGQLHPHEEALRLIAGYFGLAPDTLLEARAPRARRQPSPAIKRRHLSSMLKDIPDEHLDEAVRLVADLVRRCDRRPDIARCAVQLAALPRTLNGATGPLAPAL